MELPAAFEERMRRQLGADFSAFAAALDAPPPVSIRMNPRKRFALPATMQRVPWHAEGYYLEERPVFTLDPFFHAGAYYVQEASSMFVGEAVRQLIPGDRPVRALDLAAAPGGKSTLLAAALPSGSLLVANEVIRSRFQILQENLTRWGYPITHAANHDPRDWAGLAGFFDLVLLDAPCSGEGLFRKDPGARSEWSPEAVVHCAARQQRILADTLPLVAPGGILLYATCTYNDSENEGNAAWIAKQDGFDPVPLSHPAEWGIVDREFGCQFFPHRVRGEGFYLAAFRRRDGDAFRSGKSQPFRALTPLPRQQAERLKDWLASSDGLAFFQKPGGGILTLPADQVEDGRLLDRHLSRLRLGTETGIFKGNDFVPDHALALSILIRPDLPAVALSREEALLYLKRELTELADVPDGWALARYEGHNLGWLKGLKNRVNNYLPKEWRIRMEL